MGKWHKYGSALLVAALAMPAVAAERPRNPAYNDLAVAPRTGQVTFQRRPARPGDRIDQRLEVSLQLESTTRNGQEIVSQQETSLKRVQQQTMVADEVVDGKTVAARVKFNQIEQTRNDSPGDPSPIEGKLYHCRQEGEQLKVTRDDGAIPTPQEYELVSASMASLGKINPLAEFFAGKTVRSGMKITLPQQVGTTLLGGDEALGKVSRFEMTLKEVVTRGTTQIARFDTELEAEAGDGAQMRLLLAGTIELEIETCRTQRLELDGPMARMSSFGSYSHRETTSVRGKMKVHMEAGYSN